ncbi:MAG TPA: GNAT family protein [Candidatus Sulfotelmatobacter sp.]|jgi:RimJ/RimL family protein N-acetyltransferase|nr:GNAT family protein [Candidatus Sulfotelmatobacter sp.]
MTSPPTLQTERLRIRPYSEADIPELVRLIGTREVAATTLRIAHPYSEQDARAFLELAKEPDKLWLAVTLRADGRQIGGIGLRVELQHQHAELGYWLGVSYWSQGYATEAAREVLRYGFEDLALHRIFASHFKHNPASGKILKKIGMRHEGSQREHLRKWDQFVDSELYGILRREWQISGEDHE